MIPVIFIHKGYQPYLEFTVKQALKNNDVVFIGDTDLPFRDEKLKIEKLSDYSENVDEFSKLYIHLNTTPFDYELFCFNRWFVLKNYMKKNGLSKIFYVDSDVLLFTNVNSEYKKYEQYEFTLLHRSAATSSFITIKGLDSFCRLLLNTYRDKSSYTFRKMDSHFRVRQSCGLAGGVCDMTALELFHYLDDLGGGPGRVGEMMQIIDDSTYDHNINTPDNDFDYSNGRKNVQIIDGIPYVFNIKLNKLIKFNCLHFQGGSKNFIQNVYTRTH